MSKKPDVMETLVDYVHQLKRHTESRRALHIKLSELERPFQEPFYRREVASALRPLVAKEGAKLFALPNADSVLVTREASLDDLAPLLRDIRNRLKGSHVIGSLDQIVGESDRFIEWFDLEQDYDDFAAYTARLVEGLKGGRSYKKGSALLKRKTGKAPKTVTTKPKGEAVAPGEAISQPREPQILDAKLLQTIVSKLPLADVEELIEGQTVVAIVGDNEPAPVLVHKFVSVANLLKALTGDEVVARNRWLDGYLQEQLGTKLLELRPDLSNDASLATSISLTCKAVLSDYFTAFDAALEPSQKNKLILEFNFIDILSNPRAYAAAHERIDPLGYKVALADVEPESLLWLDYARLHADFIKIHTPQSDDGEWLTESLEKEIAPRISQIGQARTILSGCMNEADVQQGQRLGITLFQGPFLG